MKGDPRIGLKKHSRNLQLLCSYIDYLWPKLQQFIKHNFVARWQDIQSKSVMANLPSNCILSHIYFVEKIYFPNPK